MTQTCRILACPVFAFRSQGILDVIKRHKTSDLPAEYSPPDTIPPFHGLATAHVQVRPTHTCTLTVRGACWRRDTPWRLCR